MWGWQREMRSEIREILSEMREDRRRAEERAKKRDAEMREERRRSDEHWKKRDAEWQAEHHAHLEELRAVREEQQAMRGDQKRRFDKIDAEIENGKRVAREIILELREARARDRDARDEMRAMTQGLLRVIDRLDRGDGPAPAGA